MQNRQRIEGILKKSIDILLLILSFLGSSFLAKNHAGMAAGFLHLAGWEIYFLISLCLAWNIGARILGLYDKFRMRALGIELLGLGKNIILQILVAVSILFILKTQVLSRFFIFIYLVLLLALLVFWKIFYHLLLKGLQKNGRNLIHIMIVGNGEVARNFFATIAANVRLGYKVKGFVADQPPPGFESMHLGKIDSLAQLLEGESIDEVVIALPNSFIGKIGKIIDICENYPVRVRIIPDYIQFLSPGFGISRFGPFPIVSIRANPLEQFHYLFFKRLFDVLFSLLLFVGVFSWLWPLLVLLIKISSPGPVFFKQERWGKKNARIVCYKFRSMVKESEDVDEKGRYRQATRHDPRITGLGSFLRSSNLDELPQFINVLKGEMSVVGPRPHPTPMNMEAKDSIRHYQLRHLIKPGITGWAQINGFRGETNDPDLLHKRVEFDIWYIENWSIFLDIKIICRSIFLMLKGDPMAY